MASALSEDEFHRMQLQLLELRTENYKVIDQCKRQERELQELKAAYEIKDKELQKATKVISKSKKAREVELLEQENEVLQRKLHSQEEEFRLQNETVMAELTQVIRANETLEKEVESLKSAVNSKDSEHSDKLQDEIRRLQAQNSVLQKNLTACQENHEAEILRLRQVVADLEMQCLKLSGQRGTPVGQGSMDTRTVEGQDDPGSVKPNQADGEERQVRDNGGSEATHHSSDIPSHIADVAADMETTSTHMDQGEQMKLISDLQLRLETEQEEKNLLKEQMLEAEAQFRERIKSLQDEVDKITEKFRKKQESLVQLQEEKELIYNELSNRIHEVEEVKDTEINKLKNESDKLLEELTHCNKVLEEYEDKSNIRIRELECLVNSLENRVSDVNAESSQQLETQNAQFSQQVNVLNKQITDLKKANEDLEVQRQESEMAHQKMCEELHAAQQERDKQIEALQESHRVAEKRKSLLDELAIKYQEESDQHREQVKRMEEAHKAEVNLLSDQLEEHKVRISELEYIRQATEGLKAQITSLEEAKGWLERQLNETELSLNETKQEYEESCNRQEEEHEKEIESINEEHKKKVKELSEQIEALALELTEKNSQIESLKQDIKDQAEEKKICEKKGATMLKDLKRQLHQERKRGEKLQERLQEYLADTKSRQSVEELFRPYDPNERCKGDASSVSSWNASILSRENTVTSPDEETPAMSLVQENSELLKRIGDLQQEKWMLEEKVAHLESSNSCMAEDLLQKTAVIEHYVMDSHIESAAQSPSSEKITLKKMLDMIKDRGDDNLRDMNKKLQNMLEETLTKNMHLQKDLETLSQEVVRLSKEVALNSPKHTSAKQEKNN